MHLKIIIANVSLAHGPTVISCVTNLISDCSNKTESIKVTCYCYMLHANTTILSCRLLCSHDSFFFLLTHNVVREQHVAKSYNIAPPTPSLLLQSQKCIHSHVYLINDCVTSRSCYRVRSSHAIPLHVLPNDEAAFHL